jgi:hypothetical protein
MIVAQALLPAALTLLSAQASVARLGRAERGLSPAPARARPPIRASPNVETREASVARLSRLKAVVGQARSLRGPRRPALRRARRGTARNIP